MKWLVISVANFLCLFIIEGHATTACRWLANAVEVCAPNNQWVAIESNTKTTNASNSGSVWLHREREGKQVHSFIAVPDRHQLQGTWDAYVHYAVEQFREREFLLIEKSKLPNQLELLKLSTPDKKTSFYQGYVQGRDKTIWTFNCMGPNQKIINSDCVNFMKSIRL